MKIRGNALIPALILFLALWSRAVAAETTTLTALWRVDPGCVDFLRNAEVVRKLGLASLPGVTIRPGPVDLYVTIPRELGAYTIVKGETLYGMDSTGRVDKTDTTRWIVARLSPERAAREQLDPRSAHPSRLVAVAIPHLVVDVRREPTGKFTCTYKRPHEGENIAAPIASNQVVEILAGTIVHGYVPASRRESNRRLRYDELTALRSQ